MKSQLALLIGTLVALVAACPPPFNNFRFFDNITAVREAIEEIEANKGNQGWADVVGWNNPHQPWPKANGQNKATISYCFRDQATKDAIGELLLSAWGLWREKIGEPSKESGHGLEFKEYTGGGGQGLCRRHWVGTPWDSNVPEDTIEVVHIDNPAIYAAASATTGYIPSSWDKTPGRHTVTINMPRGTNKNYRAVVAHELGHVLGLWHEHQRTDRDHYVKFQCDKLKGYADTLQQVQANGKHTIEEVCKSSYLGYYYKSAAPQFSTEPRFDTDHPDGYKYPYHVRNGFVYDYNSIMHYGGLGNHFHNSPLIRWKRGSATFQPDSEPNYENTIPIPRPWLVSDLDAIAVKNIYPWQ